MRSVYSVTQINSYIKNMFSQDFMLANVYIKGEVSNCKYHSSGHIYFTLKDKGGVMAGVMFAGNRKGLNFQMKEGQTVVACGSINVYERDGKYQLYAKEIILDGAGALYQKYEELKNKLEEMGMFSEQYKKSIPKYSTRVGIVTASTGAAIQDIINITNRRNPYVQLYLYSALVQGQGAAQSISNGIKCLDMMNLDVIIVGRGGGSIEDLWAFNEELVARTVFECNTPVISAVGHETDTTIIDYVSDFRAPTPSAAAEIAVFDIKQFEQTIGEYGYTLSCMMDRILVKNKKEVEHYKTKLRYLSPINQIKLKNQINSELKSRLKQAMYDKLKKRKNELLIMCEKLNGLSPLNKLGRGFAYITDEENNAVISANDYKCNDCINIQLKDGKLSAKIIEINNTEWNGKIEEDDGRKTEESGRSI